MNPVIHEVLVKQLRSLRHIYLVMVVSVLGILVATFWLGSPDTALVQSSGLLWIEIGLGGFTVLLLGLALPLVRRRLLDPERVRSASPKMLAAWGLSETIEPSLGRQAVFLTRYTAGCIISWSLASSVGLYGLVAAMLGAILVVVALFFAASVITMALLPPRAAWLQETMEKLQQAQ